METVPCEHNWQLTDITHTANGRKWQQIAECFYCPDCRQFSRKIRWFLDGRFHATEAEAQRANEDENQRYATAKQAWQQEHYPAHLEAR